MAFRDFGNEQVLSTLLDTMTDGVMVVDPDGTIMCLNPSAEKITGYKSAELIGKPCTVLDTDACVISGEAGKVKNCSLFKEGRVANKRCQIQSKDGHRIMLLKNAVILKDAAGEVIGAVETMTDITSLFMKELEVEQLRQELSHEVGFMGLVGTSPAMERVYEQIRNAAQSDVPVIITGESGTGKELAAAAVHRLSRRMDGPFIRVNCAALNEHLLESELFGHRKGAFTGAVSDRQGRFEAASGGTIFLDEIGDMPASMQVKLLRVLQEKEVVRIGENHPLKVDVRIITATNRNLEDLMAEGRFREDLYYRINVFPIHMPALRERTEDLALLVPHYLKRISVMNGRQIARITTEAIAALESFGWPGNVRQLVNALEYASITCAGEAIDVSDLPTYMRRESGGGRSAGTALSETGDAVRVVEALRLHNSSRTLAARELGISRVALWKKMKRLGLMGSGSLARPRKAG